MKLDDRVRVKQNKVRMQATLHTTLEQITLSPEGPISSIPDEVISFLDQANHDSPPAKSIKVLTKRMRALAHQVGLHTAGKRKTSVFQRKKSKLQSPQKEQNTQEPLSEKKMMMKVSWRDAIERMETQQHKTTNRVSKLGALERHELIDKLLKKIEEDNHRLLVKQRE
ncbi:hypothetical protein AgCh_005367 [Apium graveolens]